MMTDEEFLGLSGPSGKNALTENEFLQVGKEPPSKALEALEQYPSFVKYPILAARGVARAVPGSADVGAAMMSVLKGTPFAEERAKQAEIERAAEKTYPVTTYGGEVVGALGLPLARPAGAVARAVEPLVGGTAARALGMGTVGAGYGGASGLTSEGDIGQRWQRAKEEALVGGVGGAAIPVALDVLATGAKKVADVARQAAGKSTAPATFEQSMRATRAGQGMSPTQVQEAIAEGQPVFPIDIGGAALKQEARTATHTAGEAKDLLYSALQERRIGQQDRLIDFGTRIVGKSLTDPDVVTRIRGTARTMVTPEYKTAYSAGSSGVWTPKLESLVEHPWIERSIPNAIEEVNANRIAEGLPKIENPFTKDPSGKLILKPGQKPSLELWDAIKRDIDGKVTAAEGTPTTRGDPNVVRVGTTIKKSLLGELDSAVPEYSAARAGARKYLGEESAYRFGSKFLSSTKPNEVNAGIKAIGQFTPEELEHAQHSYMTDRIGKFMSRDPSKDVSKSFRSPEIRKKDRAILGPDKADQLEAFLIREELMDASLRALGGSTTAENLVARARQIAEHHGGVMLGGVGGAYKGYQEGGLDPVLIAKGAVGGAIAGYMAEKAIRVGEKSAVDLAKMLVSDDPAIRDEAISLVSRSPQAMSALRKADTAVTSLLSRTPELMTPRKREEIAPARASGGRVNLMSMVESSRKKIQSRTKSILEQPDESVVHALKVANGSMNDGQ